MISKHEFLRILTLSLRALGYDCVPCSLISPAKCESGEPSELILFDSSSALVVDDRGVDSCE